MAEKEVPTEQPSTTPHSVRQELWALAALAIAGLVCVSLLAVAIVFLLGRPQAPAPAPIQISNVGNTTQAQPPRAIDRPSEPAKPQAIRFSAQDRVQPALPGVLATPTPAAGARKVVVNRADPPSPPSPPPPPGPKAFFRTRGDALNLYRGQGALPMPQVYAVPDPAEKDSRRLSYEPDQPFAEAHSRGQRLELSLSNPRKTSTVDGYRAPKDFQFFTASVVLHNTDAARVALDVDKVEVRDSEGVPYLALLEMAEGWPLDLSPDQQVTVELSFLVPSAATLAEMAVDEGGPVPARVPLSAR